MSRTDKELKYPPIAPAEVDPFESGIHHPQTVLPISVPSTTYDLKYEDKDRLGAGAYGEVFKGRYQHETVAVKRFNIGHVNDLKNDRLNAIRREIKIMENSHSDYLVGIRGDFLKPPFYLVAMEFCEKGTLRDHLDNRDIEITNLDKFRWAMQASYGLSVLHHKKIWHRDLKGENVLLDNNYNAKVADFGLSIIQDSKSAELHASKPGGTIPWMAPELFEGKAHSEEADRYSLAILLWEIVSRKKPFSQYHPNQIMSWASVKGMRERILGIEENWPEVFKRCISSCWSQNPTDRPAAYQVGEAFENVIRALRSPGRTIFDPCKNKKIIGIITLIIFAFIMYKFFFKSNPTAIVPHIENDHKFPTKPYKWVEDDYDNNLSVFPMCSPANFTSTCPALFFHKPSPEPLPPQELQDELVDACEKGDIKEVQALLQRGARPNVASSGGKRPLGAAIWGMNPEVVSELTSSMDKADLMTWDEYENHNLKHYKEVFIMTNFNPRSYKEWYKLLEKMNQSLFVQTIHLKMSDEYRHDKDSSSWDNWKKYVKRGGIWSPRECTFGNSKLESKCTKKTEVEYEKFRTQIKQKIEETPRHTKVNSH